MWEESSDAEPGLRKGPWTHRIWLVSAGAEARLGPGWDPSDLLVRNVHMVS